MALQHRRFTVGQDSFDHFYLCHYRPKRAGEQDRLSKSLLRFKDGREPDLRAWIDCCVSELKPKFSNQNVSIIRALAHSEIMAVEVNPMGRLCKHLSEFVGVWDATAALSKLKPTNKLSRLPKRERYEQSIGNYMVESGLVPSKRILIIDDILTSGATMTAIINAIRQSIQSARIKVFTFAVSDYAEDANSAIVLHGYGNFTRGLGSQLNDAEESYSESYEALVRRILSDDF